MQQYHKNPTYLEAIKYVDLYKTSDFKGEVGLQNTILNSQADKVLTSQNNTIITLLVQVHQKLAILENRILQLEQTTLPSISTQKIEQVSNNLEKTIEKISKELEQRIINLEQRTTEIPLPVQLPPDSLDELVNKFSQKLTIVKKQKRN